MVAKQQDIQQVSNQYGDQLVAERIGRESEILKLTMRISELELLLSKKHNAQIQLPMASNGAESKVSIKLKWKEGMKAPFWISSAYLGMMPAAVDGNTVYVMEGTKIRAYSANIPGWLRLPEAH